MPRALPAAPLPLSAALVVSCLLLAVPLAGCATACLRRAPEIPHTVSFNTHAYERLSLKALRGRVVLLFFWPGNPIGCRQVIDDMNRLYAAHRADGLEVIGVPAPSWESLEGSVQYLFEAVKACGIAFPVVMDEGGRIKAAYGILSVPSVCLVDRNGFIRARYRPVLDIGSIEATLGHLLTRDARPAPRGTPAPVTETKRFRGLL